MELRMNKKEVKQLIEHHYFQLENNKGISDALNEYSISLSNILMRVDDEVNNIMSDFESYWINDQDTALAKKFALAAYREYFAKGINIQPKEIIAGVAAEIGLDGDACRAAIDDETYKKKLKDGTADAIERKVCGSPFFFIDDEPFWGNDRLDMIDMWLEKGGW